MRFTLRFKIIMIFFIFLVVGGGAWYMNFQAYRQLTRSLKLLEQKDTFLNCILETRRYEKNYFLSGGEDNLSEALKFAQQSYHQLEAIQSHLTDDHVPQNYASLLSTVDNYQKALAELLENNVSRTNSPGNPAQSDRQHDYLANIRDQGKYLTTEAEKMVKGQQSWVKKLLVKKKRYHFIALVEIVGLCLFIVFFMFFSVNRPLKTIETGIARIVRGDYKNLPSMSKGDEFEDLVTSVNAMLDEIRRRTEQLIQNRKMASLGTLTSGVAHELNNPLNNISTTVQILLEEINEGDIDYMRMQLEEVEKQVERARDIVKALLEFSRETDFSTQQMYLHELIEKALKLLKGEVPSSIDIETDLATDIEIQVDPRMIQQVLINLIVNSIQAMPDGGQLYIRGFEGPDGETVCIQIKDTGDGISQMDLPKIFDPFFSTKEVGQGTGLGLSVSHGIIKKHGGRIEVESEPGKGTSFIIFLPVHPVHAFEYDSENNEETNASQSDPSIE